jgi:hypothetical protein
MISGPASTDAVVYPDINFEFEGLVYSDVTSIERRVRSGHQLLSGFYGAQTNRSLFNLRRR